MKPFRFIYFCLFRYYEDGDSLLNHGLPVVLLTFGTTSWILAILGWVHAFTFERRLGVTWAATAFGCVLAFFVIYFFVQGRYNKIFEEFHQSVYDSRALKVAAWLYIPLGLFILGLSIMSNRHLPV